MSSIGSNDTVTLAGNGNGNGNSHSLVPLDGRFAGVPALNWPYGFPTRPDILSAKPSPSALWHALRRRWVIGVGLGGLVGVVVGAIVWLIVPIRYEAEALLRVNLAQKTDLLVEPNVNEQEFQTFKRTQAALIKSSFVLNATLRRPEISGLSMVKEHKEDPVAWLISELNVDYPGEAEVLRISMKGDRPAELVKIVNAVKDAYIGEIVDRDMENRATQREMLKDAADRYKREIRDKAKRLEDLEKTHNEGNTETDKKLAYRNLDEFLEQRTRIQDNLAENQMKIEMLQAQKEMAEKRTLPESVIRQFMDRDPYIQQLSQRMEGVREQLAEEESRVRPGSAARSVTRLRKHLDELEDKMDERKTELLPQIMEMWPGAGAENQQALPMLELEAEGLKKSLKDVNDRLDAQVKQLQKIKSSVADIEQQRQELLYLQDVTRQIDTQLKIRNLDRENRPRVNLIQPATTPSGNDALRKYVAVLFSSGIGFGLVLFGVAFLEFQARRLNNVRDVSEGLGIRVLGDLPSFSGRVWRRIRAGHDPQGAMQAILAESIDSIRAALIHASNPPKVVMITSGEPQEGKTTVATQLAGSLARSGRRTLFIDGDVRHPAAHRVFEVPQEPGLCELLRGQVEREAVIHPTQAPNLWVMPAGHCDLQSVQALSSATLGNALTALRAEFDYIVIDSGPVLKVADPLLLGQHVDAAILSVLRDVSQVPRVYETAERLRAVGINVMGAVVNGITGHAVRNPIALPRAAAV